MKFQRLLAVFLLAFLSIGSSVFSANFTVASYNCGGLTNHYDYIRAVCMQKLVQERYNSEPAVMAQLEKIQNTALKMLFSEDQTARKKWDDEKYAECLARITSHPDDPESINKVWRERCEQTVTPYNVCPVVIHDAEVGAMLQDHLRDLTKGQNIDLSQEAPLNDWLEVARRVMAKRIFAHQLNYDIICLQEADYLDRSVFPDWSAPHKNRTT